ncbi:hypothetical protein CDD81_4764 [Ophiocordyceps australis]|uniref:Uncharacterized protein n=1 Tax=Ophiocordyceps australis TaxID=1399860 RepID=A0A2C5Y9Z8_9HYPO|nr:hypothetical protein CDD81_4764 [Ophiocordyceps australis]
MRGLWQYSAPVETQAASSSQLAHGRKRWEKKKTAASLKGEGITNSCDKMRGTDGLRYQPGQSRSPGQPPTAFLEKGRRSTVHKTVETDAVGRSMSANDCVAAAYSHVPGLVVA